MKFNYPTRFCYLPFHRKFLVLTENQRPAVLEIQQRAGFFQQCWMLDVGLLRYISDGRVLSWPSVGKRAEDCTLKILFRSVRFDFVDFGSDR